MTIEQAQQRIAVLEAALCNFETCEDCDGAGEFWPHCEMCEDSTCDHECPEREVCDICNGTGKNPQVARALSGNTTALDAAFARAKEEGVREALCGVLERLGGDGTTLALNTATSAATSDEIYRHVRYLETTARDVEREQIAQLHEERQKLCEQLEAVATSDGRDARASAFSERAQVHREAAEAIRALGDTPRAPPPSGR